MNWGTYFWDAYNKARASKQSEADRLREYELAQAQLDIARKAEGRLERHGERGLNLQEDSAKWQQRTTEELEFMTPEQLKALENHFPGVSKLSQGGRVPASRVREYIQNLQFDKGYNQADRHFNATEQRLRDFHADNVGLQNKYYGLAATEGKLNNQLKTFQVQDYLDQRNATKDIMQFGLSNFFPSQAALKYNTDRQVFNENVTGEGMSDLPGLLNYWFSDDKDKAYNKRVQQLGNQAMQKLFALGQKNPAIYGTPIWQQTVLNMPNAMGQRYGVNTRNPFWWLPTQGQGGEQ